MTLKNDLLMDKRIVQRNIEQGKLDPVEYQKLLDALPDASDKVWRRTESSGTQAGSGVKKSPVQSPYTPRVLEPVQAGAGFEPDAFSAADDEDDEDDEDDDDLDDADDADESEDGEKAGEDEGDDEDEDDDEDDESDDAPDSPD